MAVKSANGFIPEVWDAVIKRAYESSLVSKSIVDDRSGMVSEGDTIHFNGLSDPAVASYSAASALTYETLVDSRVSLLVDQQNKYSFIVDDIEKAMANVDLRGSQAKRAGYALAKTCDSYVFGATTTAKCGSTITDATLDTVTAISLFSQISRKLEEANVPMGEKWVVIPPWVKEKLLLAGVVHQINDGMDGKKGGMKWANYLDLDIYISTNLRNYVAGSGACSAFAGSYRAIGYAESLLKNEVLKDADYFGDFCRGLQVFGSEVIFPTELINLQLTYYAESTI